MEAAAPNNELKDELKTRISSLKRQTIIFLLCTILSVFYAIYLSNNLKKANASLEKTEQRLADESESWRNLLKTNNQKWQDSLTKLTKQYSIPPKYNYNDNVNLYIEPEIPANTEPLPPIANVDGNQILKIKTKDDIIANRIIVPKADIISEAKIMNRRNYLGYLIYIQAVNNSRYSKSAQNILRARGFTVPAIEQMEKIKQSGIIYFHDDDKSIADSIRSILVSSFRKTPKNIDRSFRVIDRTNIKAPKGQLEIWLNE